MSHRLNRHYRDHLFWLYPIFFLGLAFYAIMADKHDLKNKQHDSSDNYFYNAISHQTELVDSLQSADKVKRSNFLNAY